MQCRLPCIEQRPRRPAYGLPGETGNGSLNSTTPGLQPTHIALRRYRRPLGDGRNPGVVVAPRIELLVVPLPAHHHDYHWVRRRPVVPTSSIGLPKLLPTTYLDQGPARGGACLLHGA